MRSSFTGNPCYVSTIVFSSVCPNIHKKQCLISRNSYEKLVKYAMSDKNSILLISQDSVRAGNMDVGKSVREVAYFTRNIQTYTL
jgi:hypothetical protein